MAGQRAIDLALDLARMPALAAVMREQALPPDLLDVIRVAAGCPEASKAALASTQEPPSVIQAAAVLYLEEILFSRTRVFIAISAFQPVHRRLKCAFICAGSCNGCIPITIRMRRRLCLPLASLAHGASSGAESGPKAVL